MGSNPSSLRPPHQATAPRAAENTTTTQAPSRFLYSTRPLPPLRTDHPKTNAAATTEGGTPLLLPYDVIFDILSWVPVKSLCRFRSVCREWCTLVSDPAFVAANKTRTEPVLAIAANSGSEPSTLRLIDMDGNIIKVIRTTDWILRFVCTSPGNLICVVGTSSERVKVLNLATGEATVIRIKFKFMGFGRAVRSGVYKMVCISPRTCEILTVGDGIGWRQMQPLPNDISYNSRPVVVKGMMYLMLGVQLDGHSVICFDLESEKWKGAIKGPPNIQLHRFDIALCELNGALCMLQPEVGNIDHGSMSIWLLVDSCKGIWIKAYSIPVKSSTFRPMMILRILRDNGKLLFYLTSDKEYPVLQLYDPRHRTFTDAPKILTGDNGGAVSLCSLHLDSFLPAKGPVH